MARHPRLFRAAPPPQSGPLDFGETPAQRIFRELRAKLGDGKHVRPCGCCGTRTGPTKPDAAQRPCGCTLRLCTEEGCYKCLRHCPHQKPRGPWV